MKQYQTAELTNGLRVICLPSNSQVVYCGFQIAAGTRHEKPEEEGLAHFCEHTTFKGTSKRSSLQILSSLERVGGDLNAFTNKEDTVYYAAITKEHLTRAVDLLCDIVFHSTYPQHELDKEIYVICDEIESYNDSPAELIYDDFENILFKGHPLGHNILGTEERLRTYTTANALHFTTRHYVPSNAIFFAYGNVDFDKLLRLLENKLDMEPRADFKQEQRPADTGLLAPLHAQTVISHRATHQAHVMIGSRAYDFHHEKRIPLYLLNNILGGPGMSARLSIALREKNALVYTVESSMVSYSDTGAWCTYFGCDPQDVSRCLRLVSHELDKMMQKPLSSRQLSVAKQQIKGQIAIACDNRENFALDFGKSFLHNGKEKDIDQLFAQIDEISPAHLQEVAQEIFSPQRLITLEFI